MGTVVLVLGYSGSGKSYSLRNLDPEAVGVLNVVGKPMPFRKKLPTVDGATYADVMQALKSNNRRLYVIDDAGYLMQFDNFARARVTGYGKFTEMALSFEQVLETAARATDPDTIVYVLMHPEADEAGNLKPKTIGKMLDQQLCVEGMAPIVLVCEVNRDGYWFRTNGGGIEKSPPGMFEADLIPNDLAEVDKAIRGFYGMQPARIEKKTTKKRSE